MKTIELKLYEFDELSEKSKQIAIEHYRNVNNEYFWADDNKSSMEKFAEIFPIKITHWCYGERGEGVSFHFTARDEVEELSGWRLVSYLWNNYKNELFKGKYYGDAHVKKIIRHNRIKNPKDYKNGNFGNPYYSAITLDNSCVLTGYCMDNDILGPIYDFMNKADNRTFKDLLDDCFSAWITACNEDVEYQDSDEFISEELQSSDDLFTEDGKVFNQSKIAS